MSMLLAAALKEAKRAKQEEMLVALLKAQHDFIGDTGAPHAFASAGQLTQLCYDFAAEHGYEPVTGYLGSVLN